MANDERAAVTLPFLLAVLAAMVGCANCAGGRAWSAEWRLRRSRCHCVAAECEAPRLALGQRGVSPRPSAHPGAPSDHHHRQHLSVLPACGVATKAPPCALVAFVAVQATQPLLPTGRASADRRAGGDRGVGQTEMVPLRGPFALSLSKGCDGPVANCVGDAAAPQ